MLKILIKNYILLVSMRKAVKDLIKNVFIMRLILVLVILLLCFFFLKISEFLLYKFITVGYAEESVISKDQDKDKLEKKSKVLIAIKNTLYYV
jgi:hypothetical protein